MRRKNDDDWDCELLARSECSRQRYHSVAIVTSLDSKSNDNRSSPVAFDGYRVIRATQLLPNFSLFLSPLLSTSTNFLSLAT